MLETASAAMETLLSIDGLTVAVAGSSGSPVLRDLSFQVDRAEFVALVGESGSGKTVTALSVLGLLPPSLRLQGGRLHLDDVDLLGTDVSDLRKVRGGRIGMIFQEPLAALNPVLTIGYQIAEVIRAHEDMSRRAARIEAERLLELVTMPSPGELMKSYPHQLSGGQRQRAMIAIALAAAPDLLIADEPTTGLDVSVQAQIMDLLEALRERFGLAVLLITHDLAVVAERCDRVLMMYAGEIVEEADAETLFTRPAHPYTKALLSSLPRLGNAESGDVLPVMPGQAPDFSRLPPGCTFYPRCGESLDYCSDTVPPNVELGTRHRARCFLFAPEHR
jgi:oligopeptide/dipeptide ABC transporter ATP-binding protein